MVADCLYFRSSTVFISKNVKNAPSAPGASVSFCKREVIFCSCKDLEKNNLFYFNKNTEKGNLKFVSHFEKKQYTSTFHFFADVRGLRAVLRCG